MLVDEEVLAVVLAVITAAGILTASQTLPVGRVAEPFSELAILGPEMKIGNYPREVAAGESFKLHVYVGNHEGRVMYYAVLIKLGNKSTPINETEPTNAPIIARYESILLNSNSENHTYPITLRIDKPGVNYRLIFELWRYDESIHRFRYHQRWCQLWLNVTESSLKP